MEGDNLETQPSPTQDLAAEAAAAQPEVQLDVLSAQLPGLTAMVEAMALKQEASMAQTAALERQVINHQLNIEHLQEVKPSSEAGKAVAPAPETKAPTTEGAKESSAGAEHEPDLSGTTREPSHTRKLQKLELSAFTGTKYDGTPAKHAPWVTTITETLAHIEQGRQGCHDTLRSVPRSQARCDHVPALLVPRPRPDPRQTQSACNVCT